MKINDLIDRLFYNSTGQLIISAIFGLSIALLFKRVCKENCVLYFAPKKEEIENFKNEAKVRIERYLNSLNLQTEPKIFAQLNEKDKYLFYQHIGLLYHL